MWKRRLELCTKEFTSYELKKIKFTKPYLQIMDELELYGMHQAALKYPQNNAQIRYIMDTDSEKLHFNNIILLIFYYRPPPFPH